MASDIDISNINSFHLDVLKEIGNIGAGNSALLREVLDKKRHESTKLELQLRCDVLGGAELRLLAFCWV